MSNALSKRIVIANRLSDGSVVWLSKSGLWVDPIAAPFLIESDTDSAWADKAIAEALEGNNIIEPQVVDVDDNLTPLHPKHQILLKGPTVRPDLGYQATGRSVQAKAYAEAERALVHVSI